MAHSRYLEQIPSDPFIASILEDVMTWGSSLLERWPMPAPDMASALESPAESTPPTAPAPNAPADFSAFQSRNSHLFTPSPGNAGYPSLLPSNQNSIGSAPPMAPWPNVGFDFARFESQNAHSSGPYLGNLPEGLSPMPAEPLAPANLAGPTMPIVLGHNRYFDFSFHQSHNAQQFTQRRGNSLGSVTALLDAAPPNSSAQLSHQNIVVPQKVTAGHQRKNPTAINVVTQDAKVANLGLGYKSFPDRGFRCNMCDYVVPPTYRYNMERHVLNVHGNGSTFYCPEFGCNKRYKYSGDLDAHMRAHHGKPEAQPRAKKQKVSEKNFPCKHFDLSTSPGEDRRSHRPSKPSSPVKRFPCKYFNQCKKTYVNLNGRHYHNHLKTKHGLIVMPPGPTTYGTVPTSPRQNYPTPGSSR